MFKLYEVLIQFTLQGQQYAFAVGDIVALDPVKVADFVQLKYLKEIV